MSQLKQSRESLLQQVRDLQQERDDLLREQRAVRRGNPDYRKYIWSTTSSTTRAHYSNNLRTNLRPLCLGREPMRAAVGSSPGRRKLCKRCEAEARERGSR